MRHGSGAWLGAWGARARSLRVLPLAVAILSVLSCAPSLPEQARVRRVIDGDTVELTGGQLVRYLGIDTPEVRVRNGNSWVERPEPFGLEATKANRRWVEGQIVRLEYDVQTRDRFGRLLAYVYLPAKDGAASRAGEVMVNEELLREGLARPLIMAPNVRHAARFRALAEEARRARRGLWGSS